ncbi:MAG: retroviral-like aspartic protease family protein, partial [Nitrospinae bacterium]|nr:retroviral-like aspartic protease family protein [Nitrospinota bacterium]
MRTVVLTAAVAVMAAATAAWGETVRWTDELGRPHYTDEPTSVPAPRRDTITPMTGPPERDESPVADTAAYPVAPGATSSPLVYEAPLVPHGYSYFVDAVLDTGVTARLLLDTGATFTIVSPEVGKRMGYTDLTKLPRMPVSTAGGGAWVYLIRIHKLVAGTARVE